MGLGFSAQTNESTSYKDALAQSDFSNWKSTMDSKYYSIIKHWFWFLALWDQSMVGCKWVYKCKYKVDETIIDI
jgi:hypothetical protein